jgi:serine/threonine protein kinase
MIGARAGGYLLEAELGRGAHGVVWRGRNELTGHLAAVKVLRNGAAAAVREGRAAAAVRHPNIVQLLDVSTLATGEVYVAMEHVTGRSLQAELEVRRVLPAGEALAILDQVAAGLGALHDAGVVHRDVKPANIMLAADGRVVLLDLGLALLSEDASLDATQVGGGGGTPGYTAPEQAAALRDVDGRADVYSLGMLAARMLTGETPFVRPGGTNSVLAVLDRARAEPHELHAALAAALPADWAEPIARATAFDRSLRTRSPLDLVRALRVAGAAPARGRRRVARRAAAAVAAMAAGAYWVATREAAPLAAPAPAATAAIRATVDAAPDAAAPADASVRRRRAMDAGVPDLDLDRPLGPL